MKNMKRLFALLVAIMILVAGVAAYAEGNETPAANPDFSITVKNAVENETYTAYKILDLSVDDPTNPAAYRYTVNSAWAAFAETEAFTKVFTVDTQGYVTAKSGVQSEAAWSSASDLSAFAEAAGKYAADNNIGVAGSVTIAEGATSGKIDLTGAGYYVVTSTLGSRAMTATTPANPGVEINEKNEGDTIEKEVQEDSTEAWGEENDAQVGDTVNFHSEATIAARSINVKIHDKMDSGLTLNASSIKVYTDAAYSTEYADAVIKTGDDAEGEDTFTIVIPDSFAAEATAAQKLYIAYTAELNQNAVVKDANGVAIVDQYNRTHVTYGDDTSSEEDHTKTTTHYAVVHKYAGNDTGTELAGAVFQVKKGGTLLNMIKLDDRNYRIVDDTETGTASSHANNGELNNIAANAIVSDFVTVDAGTITIWGLDSDSDYTVTEIQAPKGYNLVAEAQNLVYDADNAVFMQTDVQNNTGSQLPSTGGVGTTIFYVGGSILVIAAVILLVTKRRMSTHD